MGTINQGANWEHVIISWNYQHMTVQFTDLTEVDAGEDAPTDWLWNFGDGHFSTDQHPIHTFRGKFDQRYQVFTNAIRHVEYTVTLTTWAGGSFKNDLFYLPVIGKRWRGGFDDGFPSWGEAQAQVFRNNPINTWTAVAVSNPRYEVNKPTTWRYNTQMTDLSIDLSAHDPANFVGYTQFGINVFWWGTRHYGDVLGADNGVPFALRFGKWNNTANTWATFLGEEDVQRPNDYDVQHIRWLTASPAVTYEGFDFSKFAGIEGIQYFRCCDGYEYKKSVQAELLAGYALFANPMRTQIWQDIQAKNKGIISKVITPNELVISRPAILYSGIREAYFSDGWEDRKNFYLEVSKANPCTIQFFDLYVNTNNE